MSSIDGVNSMRHPVARSGRSPTLWLWIFHIVIASAVVHIES